MEQYTVPDEIEHKTTTYGADATNHDSDSSSSDDKARPQHQTHKYPVLHQHHNTIDDETVNDAEIAKMLHKSEIDSVNQIGQEHFNLVCKQHNRAEEIIEHKNNQIKALQRQQKDHLGLTKTGLYWIENFDFFADNIINPTIQPIGLTIDTKNPLIQTTESTIHISLSSINVYLSYLANDWSAVAATVANSLLFNMRNTEYLKSDNAFIQCAIDVARATTPSLVSLNMLSAEITAGLTVTKCITKHYVGPESSILPAIDAANAIINIATFLPAIDVNAIMNIATGPQPAIKAGEAIKALYFTTSAAFILTQVSGQMHDATSHDDL